MLLQCCCRNEAKIICFADEGSYCRLVMWVEDGDFFELTLNNLHRDTQLFLRSALEVERLYQNFG